MYKRRKINSTTQKLDSGRIENDDVELAYSLLEYKHKRARNGIKIVHEIYSLEGSVVYVNFCFAFAAFPFSNCGFEEFHSHCSCETSLILFHFIRQHTSFTSPFQSTFMLLSFTLTIDTNCEKINFSSQSLFIFATLDRDFLLSSPQETQFQVSRGFFLPADRDSTEFRELFLQTNGEMQRTALLKISFRADQPTVVQLILN